MVKQEIYKINDFSTPTGWRSLFIGTSLGTHTHTGLHQSEDEIDKIHAIQPEHLVICRKQYKNHYTMSF